MKRTIYHGTNPNLKSIEIEKTKNTFQINFVAFIIQFFILSFMMLFTDAKLFDSGRLVNLFVGGFFLVSSIMTFEKYYMYQQYRKAYILRMYRLYVKLKKMAIDVNKNHEPKFIANKLAPPNDPSKLIFYIFVYQRLFEYKKKALIFPSNSLHITVDLKKEYLPIVLFRKYDNDSIPLLAIGSEPMEDEHDMSKICIQLFDKHLFLSIMKNM